MSCHIKDTFEQFANNLCKGSVNVNVGHLYTVYFTQLDDGRIFIDCVLWVDNMKVLVSFKYEKGINMVNAYKLYCQIFDISLHEKF